MKHQLIGILFLLSQQGLAAPSVFSDVTADQPVCYGREYNESVLKARPLQTVQKIQAKLSHDAEYNQNIMTVEITLKGKKNLYTNYRSMLFCDKDDHCYVECDGGSVNTKIQSDGTLLIKNNGFVIHGGCGDEGEDIEGILLKRTEGGDDLFKLFRLPKEFCQKVPDDYN
jgi:hypothetical protein